MRKLHELPRFSDRWSYLYLETGRLDQDANGLVFHNALGQTQIPINQLSLVMLGPGTTITHAAVKAMARNNCLLAWVGQTGVRLYAHSTGGTFSARRLLNQARAWADEKLRLEVVNRMYQKRFPDCPLHDKTIEQIRGMEGLRVRKAYETAAAANHIPWKGRAYDQDDWFRANAANRALSTANACLYGICHAAIVSAGYSAGLGFIHTGKLLSFVYDIADLYKTDTTIPVAFRVAGSITKTLEHDVRVACRDQIHDLRLMDRIIPDIQEVLGASHDPRENPEDLEGRAVSLAD
jgi:CRISPR-associated protein Cas1